MEKLISFDLKAKFGFFKKPDINDNISNGSKESYGLTFNILHKPALLGILGAIIGKGGYNENRKFPIYYSDLKALKIGIKPLSAKEGDNAFNGYTKEIIRYNNSTGFASDEEGGNLKVAEQVLIDPSYRCFLLLNLEISDERTLYELVLSYQAEFIPYLGKNDFSAWWTDAKEHKDIEPFDFSHSYKVNSIFAKTEAVSGFVTKSMSRGAGLGEATYLYFERLPIGFDEELYQYIYGDFVYSNASFTKEMNMSNVGDFYKLDEDTIIQLF